SARGAQHVERASKPRDSPADDVQSHATSGDGARLRARREAGVEDQIRNGVVRCLTWVDQPGLQTAADNSCTIEARTVVAYVDANLVSHAGCGQLDRSHLVLAGAD